MITKCIRKHHTFVSVLVSASLIALVLFSFSATVFADDASSTVPDDGALVSASSTEIAIVDVTSTTPISPIAITLDIEGTTSTIFNGSVSVEPCSPLPTASSTINAYCAILQSGVSSTWSTYGTDLFVDSIGGEANDYGNSFYWTWFSNLEYGQTSLSVHILSPGETVLVTLARMPLKLDVATTTPLQNTTDTVSVFHFGFDDSFNGVWLPSPSSSVSINGTFFPVSASSTYDIAITSTTTLAVFASQPGFLDSSSVTIAPIAVVAATTTASSTDSDANIDSSGVGGSGTGVESVTVGGAGGGGGGGSSATHHFVDVDAAVRFLVSQQLANGSFGSPLYTDWAAIALAGHPSDSTVKLAAYLQSANTGPSTITDYERHAMALMAQGINPATGTSVNYIQRIVTAFDGTQIGDPSLVNDDIFSLFPLTKIGYGSDDPMITKIVSFIVSEQSANGSWDGTPDMTAAALQALSAYPGLIGVLNALTLGRAYLVAHQGVNGGFGNSFSTSWALQGISALHESGSMWLVNNANPQDYLFSLQASDGGIESTSTDVGTRIWATSYAIPASVGTTWYSLLGSFLKPTGIVQPAVGFVLTSTSTSTVAQAPSSTVSTSTAPTIVSPASSSSIDLWSGDVVASPSVANVVLVPSKNKIAQSTSSASFSSNAFLSSTHALATPASPASATVNTANVSTSLGGRIKNAFSHIGSLILSGYASTITFIGLFHW